MPVKLRLGTRGSRLALAQAAKVSQLLIASHSELEIETVVIRTSGDKGDRDVLGCFVREIQHALLDGQIDAALHCLKDLPTAQVEGLELSAYLAREDPRDALIAPKPSLLELPNGAHVGTGSIRRTAQLLAIRPDLRFSPLVGNIDTRLKRVEDSEYDAIILAVAGLSRLGLLDNWKSSLIVSPLPIGEMLPAPGQAVLVLETRGDEYGEMVRALDSKAVRRASTSERAFLSRFGTGCSMPVAAYATCAGESIDLTGLVAAQDGRRIVRSSLSGTDPSAIATAVYEKVCELGARELIPG